MAELVLSLILLSLAAYAIGRLITQESIFSWLRSLVESKCLAPKELREAIFNEELGKFLPAVSPTGKRLDIDPKKANLLLKIAELFNCPFCMSAQAALWLTGLVVTFEVFTAIWIAPFAVIGVTFLINDWLNRG